ncbi:MAG: hypothetical protein ACD_40C00300G0001 [uncultured bacterium]|nr:MAG: hypothetical protein ACD_40C00300G0001 [uncultured bacterium]
MIVLKTEYKVIWRYVNSNGYYFAEGNNILPRFQQFCIASNIKKETLYLFSIMNSRLTDWIISKQLASDNEKDLLLGITVIKDYVRVPRISEKNQFIKDFVIERTGEMIEMEKQTVGELVELDGIMVQKIDRVRIEKDGMILSVGNKEIKAKIKRGSELLSKIDFGENIDLQDLRNWRAFDREAQGEIKAHIDDLVYALYFGVKIGEKEMKDWGRVRSQCEKHEFYKLVNEVKK